MKSASKILTYTAVLIGLYLIVANASGFGKALTSTAQAYATGVKVLQARP